MKDLNLKGNEKESFETDAEKKAFMQYKSQFIQKQLLKLTEDHYVKRNLLARVKDAYNTIAKRRRERLQSNGLQEDGKSEGMSLP